MADTIRLASGATEADIIKALGSLKNGGTVILPEGESILISKGLSIDVSNRDITLDLNGSTLVKAGNVSVITGSANHDAAVSVKLGEAGDNTTITYSKLPAGLTAGSWVKVISDDGLPGDLKDASQAKMGQALEVLSIDGNKVTFKGHLIDQDHYDTNVRATTYANGELVIKNGEIVGDQSHPTWNSPLVQLRSLVDARIDDLQIHDGIGRGVQVVDGVNNVITDISVKNMLDGGSAALGIGVSSLSSTGTTVKGYYAEKVHHAADNNAIGVKANAAYVVQYGGDIGMHVEDAVAYGTRNFAFSWHSEAVEGSFHNVMAFDSFGFLLARGIGNQMTDSGGAGNVRGIMLYEYGTDDARNIDISGVTLKETSNYSIYSSYDPVNNTIKDSFFETLVNSNLASAKAVTLSDTELVRASAANPNDVITGTGKAEMLLGGKGADKISGGGGDDYIWGGAGVDTLTGGAGRDRFAFHSLGEIGDTITDFETGGSGDVIDLSVLMAKYNWPAGDPIASGYVRFVQNGTNSLVQVDAAHTGKFVTVATLIDTNSSELSLANLRLSLSEDTTRSQAPAAPEAPAPAPVPEVPPAPVVLPVMTGGEGNDVIQAGAGTVQLVGAGGDDQLTAHSGDTLLQGGAGNDTLTGAAGNDTLDGGTGNDVMAGGAGNDTYYVDSAGDAVIENADAGFDTIVTDAQLSGPLADNVEGLTLTGDADLAAIGNALDNVLIGNAGDNELFGGAGSDVLHGGAGNDSLDGGTGADTMAGGAGDDTYYVDSAGDVVTEDAGQGYDTVLTGTDLGRPLAANVEALTLTGNANLSGTGNELANTITGNAGDNVLSGGGGNDTLYGGAGNDTLDGGTGDDVMAGGAGNDTYYVDSLGDVVTENAGEGYDTIVTSVQPTGALDANIEALTLAGSADLSATGNILDNVLTGNAGNNALYGGDGNDTLYGGAGNDTLDGGTGDDVMAGGIGDDTYYVDSVGDVVTENDGEGFDTIVTGLHPTGPLAANVEGLVLTGSGNLNATGNDRDNTMSGNAGINTLFGGDGNDTIDGGAGNDALYGEAGDDTLYGGDGNDNIEGGAGDDILYGGAGNDRMLGGDGNDVMEGGEGADSISGGLGYDTVSYENATSGATVDLANYANNAGSAAGDALFSMENARGSAFDDIITGAQNANTLDGGAGNDRLYGAAGNDTIYGGSGADWLEGGVGKDILTGGEQNDIFYFASVADAGDIITDFHPGEDKIALSGAGFGLTSLDDVAFVSGAGVSATTGKSTLIYNSNSGQLLWDADGTGAQKALLLATLTDAPHLSHGDFEVT